jgi:hypothetical protein
MMVWLPSGMKTVRRGEKRIGREARKRELPLYGMTTGKRAAICILKMASVKENIPCGIGVARNILK